MCFYTATSADISAAPVCESPKAPRKSAEKFTPVNGGLYPISPYGMSNAPLTVQPLTLRYLLCATAGLTDAASYAALQTMVNTIYAWQAGTYTRNPTGANVANTGGKYGDLVLLDGGGTARVAEAYWQDFVNPLVPGQTTAAVWATFSFIILSAFA